MTQSQRAGSRDLAPDPLVARIGALCDELEHWVDLPLVPDVQRVRDQVGSPLRVAVAGRVNAGKSTLVNALVGRRVAPTAATECTQVVTAYRYDAVPAATLVLTDGTRRPLPFSGTLPDDLGVPPETVARIDVSLPEGALRRLTIIDTPGLSGLTPGREEATRAVVIGDAVAIGDAASRRVMGEVDAVLFVLRDVGRHDELEFVRQYRSASSRDHGGAAEVVAVLSHADEFGAGAHGEEDPLVLARRQADRVSRELSADLVDTVAVAGLLGETSRTGRLREEDAVALARLAGVDDTRLRLWRTARPHDGVGVDEAAVVRLEAALSAYGLRHARQVAASGLGPLNRWLEERSGLAELTAVLHRRFTDRADALKVERALLALERLALDPRATRACGTRLRDKVEQVRLEPLSHRLREVRALETLRRAAPPHGELIHVLERLVARVPQHELVGLPADATPPDVAAAVHQNARWAAAVAGTPGQPSVVAECARVVTRSFLLRSSTPR